MNNIYIIGVGQMGRAILFELRRSILYYHLKPVEVCADRTAYLASRGVEVSKRIENIDDDDVVVILAVPPQQFQSVIRDNQLLLFHRGPVISVMAGITTNSLCRTLGHTRIVRSIPNAPSEVQEGVTFYYVQESADSDLITVAKKFSARLAFACKLIMSGSLIQVQRSQEVAPHWSLILPMRYCYTQRTKGLNPRSLGKFLRSCYTEPPCF